MEELFQQFREYINQANPSTLDELKQLISATIKERQHHLAGDDKEWLERLELRIQKKLSIPDYSIAQLAFDMAMSESSLRRRMYQVYKMSPKQYMTEQRLLMAKKMLEERQATIIAQIARSVGFRDAKAFSRCFKKRFGELPSALLRV